VKEVSTGIKQVAVLCVLKTNNKILLLRRNKEPNKDKYTPVGGKIDPYESPMKAAKRESYEETGIEVNVMKYCGLLVESSPTPYNWICFVYFSETAYFIPPACNEGELEWIEINKLLDIPTPSTDWYIYKYILENKTFMFNAEYDEQLILLEMREEIEDIIVYENS
jgi:8-oxo-dGTP diphosphatase